MSRLDSFIRRLQAQRACLDHAVNLVRSLDGPILELGLGNGRTFDHLREIAPAREIFVFERKVAAHPDCVPDEGHLLLGDIRESVPSAAARFAGRVALVHSDLGSGNPEVDDALSAFLAPHVAQMLVPGGVVVADQDLGRAGLSDAEALPLPDGVRPDRYFFYRKR